MPAGTNSSIVGVTGPEMRVQQRVRDQISAVICVVILLCYSSSCSGPSGLDDH